MFVLYKCLLSVFIVSIIFSTNVCAEKNVDLVKRKCSSKYQKYSDTVEKYIRMKEYVESCGCEVVPLYACFADNNMNFIDSLEADPELMKSAADIVSSCPEFFFAQTKLDPLIVESLMTMDQNSFKALKIILNNIPKKDIKKLTNNSNYFSYYLLTCMLIEGNDYEDPKKTNSILRKLKREISKEKVDLFTLVYVLKNIAADSISPSECYNLVDLTFETLGTKTIEKIIKIDKQALLNFLAPSSELLENSQSIGEFKLQRLQENYVEIMGYVYNLFGSKQMDDWGIKITGMISKYIPEALIEYNNSDQIKQYFQYLFENRIFSLAARGGFCDETTDEALEKMFTMFSPPQDQSYSPGNLGLIAKWFESGKLKEYMNTVSYEDFDSYIRTMYFLPKIYNTLDYNQKEIFETLLFSLPSSQVYNGMFLYFLSENTTYFDWIAENNNISEFIKSDVSPSAKKYQYILITQYPSKKDDSLFRRFINEEKNIPTEAVNILARMSTTELQDHNFTTSEKNMAMAGKVINNADNIITIASIAAVPLTAGASTALVAAMAARKASMATAKRAVKTLVKRGVKSAIKLSGKKGRKKSLRELGELTDFVAKRGRKNVVEGNMKKAIYKSDNIVTTANLSGTAATIATAYFLASKVTQQKDPCSGSISIEKKRRFELWMDQLRKK